MFTAWRERDFSFDRESRRSFFDSPPGDWVEQGEGKSYLRRARAAMENGWVCRLIVLNGKSPWEKVASADVDDVLFGVKFFEVKDEGAVRGHLIMRSEFGQIGSTA